MDEELQIRKNLNKVSNKNTLKQKFDEEEGEKKVDSDKLNDTEIELKKVCEWYLKYPEPSEDEEVEQ